jgi:predicted PurR-regulated permease PerM
MIIEFLEYSILLKIVGHPNWLVLSILAGLLTVVPYFGGLIANLIALLLASVTTPFTFLGTLIICAVFPQIDGYFTTPKVYGKTNNINPLITIMAVSVGGTLAGPIGIIAALPIYILIRTTYNFFKKDLKKEVKTLKDTI